ncbi:MAG: alpha-glucosidase [Planctomyces sp.]|nr:alpha-glucosidase [Planctomyces sp.]
MWGMRPHDSARNDAARTPPAQVRALARLAVRAAVLGAIAPSLGAAPASGPGQARTQEVLSQYTPDHRRIDGVPSGDVTRFGWLHAWRDGVVFPSFSLVREFPERISSQTEPWWAGLGYAPALSFVQTPPPPHAVAQGEAPAGLGQDALQPRLEFTFPEGTSFYGTGMVTGTLLRNDTVVRLWNSDRPGYAPESDALYQSHPWVLAVRPDGSAVGLLIDTSEPMEIACTQTRVIVTLQSSGGSMPPSVYAIERPTPQGVVRALHELTGPPMMVPKWALGYHQCRWSYEPESRVRELAQEFRARRIPATTIWLDIDYMDRYRVFTFDSAKFPDPAGLNADLARDGFRTVWMIDPGVADQPGYAVRDELVSRKLYVRDERGEMFRGDVWPGACVFPDFTKPEARAWWAGLYPGFVSVGLDGVWNDMNEPAVFSTASKTMPMHNRHAGGDYAALPGQEARRLPAAPHERYHNAYGLLMAQATYEGILAARPQRRPFVLTRAGFLGSHRYAATWTGDNSATWHDLWQSVPMALTLGLSGQPMVGPDIGGFAGNGPRDAAARATQFARWMGIGALLPFARGHTAKGNIDKEPWSFGPETEHVCRQALERRARLVPYLYTLAHRSHTDGTPIAQPLFFADPADPALRSEDNAFLLGESLLVEPQVMPDRTRVTVRPRGVWRSFDVIDQPHPDLPRLALKAGAVLPVGPIEQFVGQAGPQAPVTLYVSLDQSGRAAGTLYDDAGDGWGFRDGQFLLTTYAAQLAGDGAAVTVTIERAEGSFPRPQRPLRVVVLTDAGTFSAEGTDGRPVTVGLR